MKNTDNAVLDAPVKSKELTVVERARVALSTPTYEKEIAALVANTTSITVVKNAAGREQAHAAGMRLKNSRVTIQKSGKGAREDATAFSKAVIEEEKRLVALIEPEESRLFDLRDQWDESREKEKRELERLEAERQAVVQGRIDAIKQVIVDVAGKPSAEINDAIVAFDFQEAYAVEDFGKRIDEALQVRKETIARLDEMLEVALAREAMAAEAARRAEADRAEAARVKAEQAMERERLEARQRALDEQEAKAAAARAEQDRIAQEKRDEADRAARAERAEAQRLLDEQAAALRAERDAADKDRRAAQAKADEEAARARAAEQKRLDDEAAEARRFQQEADDARRAAEESAHAADQKRSNAASTMFAILGDWADAEINKSKQQLDKARKARDLCLIDLAE